jgi:glycosyltransferase involved in cell wall biosynthesis
MPDRVDSLSVLICTYNRAAFLDQTLRGIASCVRPEHCRLELVVVDNNSTDNTPAVVTAAAAFMPFPLRYAVEKQQGKSFALNHGLRLVTGTIVALTDDDVLTSPDWLARLVQAFDSHDVTFVFGKVLPCWGALPPPELLIQRGHAVWGPLALVDYGDDGVSYDASVFERRPLPIGANLAFRRDVLQRLGGWRTDLGKVNNTLISGEDHEIFYRLHRAGQFRGVYDPAVVVRHHVPAERLTRRYFRRWFFWHGRTMARMASTLHQHLEWSGVPHVARVPRYVYRAFLGQTWRWMRRFCSHDALGLLIEEMRWIEHLGYFAECWKLGDRAASAPQRSSVTVSNTTPSRPTPSSLSSHSLTSPRT